jgi:hypothetical protein
VACRASSGPIDVVYPKELPFAFLAFSLGLEGALLINGRPRPPKCAESILLRDDSLAVGNVGGNARDQVKS